MRFPWLFVVACVCFVAGSARATDAPYRDRDPAALARQHLDHGSPEVLEMIDASLAFGARDPRPLVEYGFGEAVAGRAESARDSYAQALEQASLPIWERRVRWSFGWALLHLDAYDEAIEQW
ncbi:MAG TPA: hypothetical protein PKZ76_18055 [Xanthomonadaceae bacterium]|nr:hypothetical protein [Xanthomonadaceae bacterium]